MNAPKIVQLHRGSYWIGPKRLLIGPFATSHDAHVDWEKKGPKEMIPQSNGISRQISEEQNDLQPRLFNEKQLIEDVFHTYRNESEGISI